MYDPRARFWRPRRAYHDVLRDLTLSVHEGEILALVGASGSGKSVLADAFMGLFDANAVASGEMWFDGSLVTPGDLGNLRGHGISLVPQGVSSLDPLMRVGEQVRGEARGADRRARKEDARRRMVRQRELFEAYEMCIRDSDNVEEAMKLAMATGANVAESVGLGDFGRVDEYSKRVTVRKLERK